MITMRTTEVEFHGGRVRTAPLTWGQEVIWDLMRDWENARTFAVLTRWMPVPLVLGLDAVREGIGDLMRRHEALRTRYHRTPTGDGTQEVLAAGSLPVELVDRSIEDPTDWTDIVTECLARNAAGGFDHETDLPVRFSVILQDGIPILLTFAVSHLSADFISADLLVADLTALLRARVDGRPVPPARPALQPADLAAREERPEGQLLDIEATRFIQRQLSRTHPDMLPPRATPVTPRFHRGQLESDAVAMAVGPAARRYRTTPSTILLSVFTALMRSVLPGPVCPVDIMLSNRMEPELATMVCSLSQGIMTVVELGGDSFAELVAQCTAVLTEARSHGRHRQRTTLGLISRAAARRGCQFNDIWSQLPGRPRPPATLAELSAVTASSSFSWVERVAEKNKDLFMGIRGTAERIHLSLFVDTALLPPGDIRAFLDTFERTVVTLAFEDVPLDQVARWFTESCARYARDR
ncbi:hypothetical protein AWV63_05975 [Micromonospora rifamycinica]|uniref:Condensation domain-containing protein n=2 Tax=Micromonosporaceae TaxID=28056 RepID=A0A120F9N2_9ACTN|nr:hypothetical protein AWV63_05975 [Micromonospora rifamycinica]SCG46856.1 Condensation domain-containing protein [Micromonospora rifamycinica]